MTSVTTDPPGPTHPRDLPPCDLVMKGGVTSGVVYPGAVMELARRYRFVKLGGTSAGAAAAAISAAAEFARQRSGAMELPGVPEFVADFQRPGFFLSLFSPTAEARPLFSLLLGLTRARGSYRRQSAALARAAIAYRPAPAAVAVLAAALIAVLLVAGFGQLPPALAVVLAILAAAVLMMVTAWAVLAPLVSLGRTVHHSLAGHGFGLCTGMAARPTDPDALAEWLHAGIQRSAQLPLSRPLTFTMLKDAGISLQMVATDLGLARPVTIPFEAEQYLFAPADLAALFPAEVVDHVLSAAGVPAEERNSTRTWFLPADELPVMIGARLSSSVPLLMSSLKLYSADPDAFAPIESYISDGAITSNFPIHFFDDWLPDHPTFGLDLVTVAEDAGGRDHAAVFMPGGDDAPRVRPSQSIRTIGRFLGQVQDASRNWRDELQAELPGFRDRVCQIRMGPGEGGFHLDADPAMVRALGERGRSAGQEILKTFDWDRHRFIRYLTVLALLRANFALMDERFGNYGKWPAEAAARFGAGDDAAAMERLLEVDRATMELIRRAAALPDTNTSWQSRPEPAMRIGPRV